MLHEENLKFGRRLGVSSKFLYAIHPRTMDYRNRLWRERERVEPADLEFGDNTSIPLTGSDTIGVSLAYPGRRIYYLHSLANREVTGTNATCAQVAVGVEAAFSSLLSERLSPRLYFASDLYHTTFRDIVLQGLPVEHFIFETGNGSMVLRKREPVVQQPEAPARECAAA